MPSYLLKDAQNMSFQETNHLFVNKFSLDASPQGLTLRTYKKLVQLHRSTLQLLGTQGDQIKALIWDLTEKSPEKAAYILNCLVAEVPSQTLNFKCRFESLRISNMRTLSPHWLNGETTNYFIDKWCRNSDTLGLGTYWANTFLFEDKACTKPFDKFDNNGKMVNDLKRSIQRREGQPQPTPESPKKKPRSKSAASKQKESVLGNVFAFVSRGVRKPSAVEASPSPPSTGSKRKDSSVANTGKEKPVTKQVTKQNSTKVMPKASQLTPNDYFTTLEQCAKKRTLGKGIPLLMLSYDMSKAVYQKRNLKKRL
ncbi:hypothetical protein K435DRAFT_849397 [Dendrothele bispora CBS 962.96]|uniref:Uncharacterized protein n=1 Tax=Dendrothele bispora (strain CBS 962.96) TaxID=1314807 RepID=A0A4S8MTD1_DENBC|nr:hypothetical protein K435DRAFT_849397 [Dendrothele bispora CBS 962.96]